ncbi:hypothetical protein E3Q02_03229 [Wallemia mellicola]|uniref:ZZ-type domain-containing protein n=1 Tax=Wallemia mellicola TaxID=1708541 RepID=A0AB38MU06_9BASI|nr:hypothetical protein E3Q02_03229 [Wallemia mellicola]
MTVVIKCSLDFKHKRITYLNRDYVNLDNLKLKLQQAYSLGKDSFSVVYIDDDGIYTTLRTDDDLDECLEYFGSDDGNITLNLEILVDYDGPSLSDTNSINTSAYNSSDSSESIKYGVKDADNCSISLSQSSSEKSSKKSFSLRSSLSKLSIKYKEQGKKLAGKPKNSKASSSNHNTNIDTFSDSPTHRQHGNDEDDTISEATHNPFKPSESTPSLNSSIGLSNKLELADESDGPDRGDLAARWFADQSERALLATFGTQLAPSETTATSDDYASSFDSDAVALELEQDGKGSYRYTLTGSMDGMFINNDEPFCSSCNKPLDNLRYICTSCGVSSCEFCPECIEGAGAVHAIENTPKHAFRECLRSDQGWINVDYGNDRSCSICKSVLAVDFKCVSCQSLNLCRRCWSSVRDIHPSHAFLELPPSDTDFSNHQLRQKRSVASNAQIRESYSKLQSRSQIAGTSSGSLPTTNRTNGNEQHNHSHSHALCSCLGDIVGPRFHCAVCAIYDLCQDCESLGAANGNGHDGTHIMMKIPVPLSNDEVQQVSARARRMWDNDRNDTPTSQTDNEQLRNLQPRRRASKRRPVNHGVQCNGCINNIIKERYACLHCAGAYNLCGECENMSYILHDPFHIFLKLEQKLKEPGLKEMGDALPILYKIPAGNPSNSLHVSPLPSTLGGPNEYLSTIKHQKVVCDRCMEPVLGKWFRCVNLAGSYDLCSTCEPNDSHKEEHIYLVIKSIVDMELFGDVAQIGSIQGKALLPGLSYAT